MQNESNVVDRRSTLSPAKQALLKKRVRGETVGRRTTPRLVEAPDQRYEPFPLTDMVEAQWMGRANAYDLGSQAARVYAEFFDSEVNLEDFGRLWRRLVERHEMLRGIVRADGQYQILEHVPPYEIAVDDLRALDPGERQARLMATRQRMARHMTPCEVWPLWEVRASLIDNKTTRLHMCCDLLVSDIKSFQVIGLEIAKLYKNPDAPLYPEKFDVSYRDYVIALDTYKQTDSYRESERYWVEQRIPTLPGAPEVPMAKTPATVDIPYFVHRGIRVDKETWRRIQAAANERGLTPDVAVCAAFSEVLGYWCKSPRLTLNVLSFQRMPLHHHINHIVGNFGSTVLLGVDAAQGKTFTERAHIIHEQLLQDLAHWNFSGVRVLRELNRRRGGTTGATMPVVFASTLNYSYTTGADPSLHPAESFYEQELRYIQLQTPQVWFDHQVAEDKGELVLEWDIVEDLFPEGLLDAMWAAYLRLLYRLADDPRAWDAAEGRGWLLPAEQLAEREAVNATAAELPLARLEALVAKAAAQRPTAPAVISGRGTLSYSTLEARATEVGLWLQGRGVSPDRLVAVVMEPGWEQVVAALGVLKAGAAYLPIEPTQPTERLHYLLAHSQASLVLTQAEWDARLEWPAGVERLVVENAPRPGGQVRRPDPGQVDDLAYVIYTSGSTGQPKGVMIDHRGAANTILDLNHRFGVGPGDTALSVSSLGFDLSVYDIFGMLAAGGRVVLPDTTQWREPAEWLALMHEHRVTIWNSVPALMEMLVEHVASRGEQWPASLRLVMLSGDWIPVGLPDRIRALGAGVEVISLGGATEASIWSIAYPIGAVDPAWESIPYGRPLRNQRFAVLNDALEPTPVWVPGQLYVGGVGLARGYWRDEEKTRAAFITHPRTGERLYRTGDLGRYLPGGDIQFLGREDLQVKVRGYRIELGEIETALQQHGAVQTAVVVAVGTSNEQRRLVAYVVGRGAEALEPDALTSFLHTKLPDYMVPAQIVTLEALPLTANGKVDRGRLASPAWLALQQERTNVVAPRDATEEQLAAIWSDLLSVRELSVHDSFFTLGGNSLMVTQVVARISETFGVELPLRSVYQAPTVAGLAAVIRAGGVMAIEDLDLAAEAVLDPSVAAAS